MGSLDLIISSPPVLIQIEGTIWFLQYKQKEIEDRDEQSITDQEPRFLDIEY